MSLMNLYPMLFIPLMLVFFACLVYQLIVQNRGPDSCSPDVHHNPTAEDRTPKDVLRIMPLTVAHGRANGARGLRRKKESIQESLNAVVSLLQRETPDIIALQEAAGPSMWSGDFNHIEYITDKASLPWAAQGRHVEGPHFNYGTALLSHLPIEATHSTTFKASPPTPAKGFLITTLTHPAAPAGIDVVSVHLDFLRSSVRQKQVEQLIRTLNVSDRPQIVMGDFNTSWESEPTLQQLAEALNLRGYKPKDNTQPTFPGNKKRLDWILISSHWNFENHRTLPDQVSDHLAVIAEVSLKTGQAAD